jgi:hypothetical protein
MIIRKVFVPSNCLQGSKLSTYLLWDKAKKIKVLLKFSDSFEIVDIYNGEIETNQNVGSVEISKFDTNGYLGLVFNTKILTDNKKTDKISFEISDGEKNIEKIDKLVFLFRPEVDLLSSPHKIILKKSENCTISSVNQGIRLRNIGDGMAVIGLKPHDSSLIKLYEPANTYNFFKSVWSDIAIFFKKLKQKFPEHDEAMNDYIDFGNYVIDHLDDIFNEKTMERHKKLNDTFEKILLSNEEFARQFVEGISTAFLKNYHLITNIENFVNYLKSIENNKILIVNPLMVLKVTKTSQKFDGEIVIFDLNGYAYPPIPINFEVDSEEECEIPLHQIFSIENGV